jgi:hypothetical protein
MITVGGPLANVLSYYINDFTSAFYGYTKYTQNQAIDNAYNFWSNGGTPNNWYGSIGAISCWSKNSYSSNSTDGYAVIGTYQDINGTTVLTVWGMDGRDTFFASQWLHGDIARGILPGLTTLYLDEEPNYGTTSIVLHISYSSSATNPTFNVVEQLGTISENQILTHPVDP